MTRQPDLQEATFEVCYERIESIVKNLEEGEKSLDESIGLYEEGMACLDRCLRLLDDAEQKIQMLIPGEKGAPKLVDYRREEAGGEDERT